MTQAAVGTEVTEGALAIGHGTGVAPDDGRTEGLEVFVDAYQAMHLIGDANGCYVVTLDLGLGHNFLKALLGILPP